MKKPWERQPRTPKSPTPGRWEPDERDGDEEDEGMARRMRSFNRKGRVFFFFVVAPLVSIFFIAAPWIAVANDRPMMEMPRVLFALAFMGPCGLWLVGLRLALSMMMLPDDELRTVEEDERQIRLWKQYIQPGSLYDWAGAVLGLAHLAIVLLAFQK